MATVSDTGMVNAVAAGSVTIAATNIATSTVSRSATVEILSEVIAAEYVSDTGYLDVTALNLAPRWFRTAWHHARTR